jgi:protein disulfide-isomerase/protein disulfide isomerase family A protein 5
MKGKHVLAAVDMERPENNLARRLFNITGFPTLLFFENGKPKYTFDGDNTKEGIINFLTNPSRPAIRQREEEWAADPNSDIVHLSTKNFNLILKEEKSVIVMFYANWCGHCKSLKPKYEAAAVKMRDKNIAGMLAAIDATKENEIASKYGVKGYPTLKYFEFGEFKFDVNLRDTDPIVKFMENPDEPPVVEVEKEVAWEDEESDVVFLNDETFKPFMKKKKHALLFMYAPWCYHCKKTKPEYAKAAKELRDDLKIAFAAVDCTKFSGICSAYDVRGYPTIKYFSYLKTQKEYSGGRTAEDFIKFMRNPEKEVEKPKADIVPFTSDNVIILDEKTFDSTLKKYKSAMVFFFMEWCGWCKKLKPIYSEAADVLRNNNDLDSALTAIDCSVASELCKKYKIEGYPTLKLFKDGKYFRDFNKERTSEAILEFINTNSGKDEL